MSESTAGLGFGDGKSSIEGDGRIYPLDGRISFQEFEGVSFKRGFVQEFDFFRGLKGEADTKTNTKTKTKTYVSVRWPDDESLHCVCLLLLFFFASVHALRLFLLL